MNAEDQAQNDRIKDWCVENSWLFHACLASIAYFIGGMEWGPIAWLGSAILQLWLGNKSQMVAIAAFSGLILTACGL